MRWPKPLVRSRLPMFLTGAGSLLILGAFLYSLSIPSDEVGNVAEVESSLRLAPPPTSPEPPLTPGPPPTGPENDRSGEPDTIAPNDDSTLDEITTDRVVVPTALHIDGIDVRAPIDPYGINPRTGEMAVPRNVTDVAWYRFGPAPGEPGSAVLAAHVDLAGQGPGVFYRLRDLDPGDSVVVTYSDGTETVFTVTARTTYEKDSLPLDVIFSRSGNPILTLITCGGGFNPSQQRYDSNVVVYAIPDESANPAPAPETT